MLLEQDHYMTIKWSLLTSFNSVLTSDRVMLVFEIVNIRVIEIFGILTNQRYFRSKTEPNFSNCVEIVSKLPFCRNFLYRVIF